MSELNDVRLFGRITKDASMRTTRTGLKIARFSIATNQFYKDENGNYVETGHFFPLSLFGQYAEKMFPKLKKGQRLIVIGYLKQNRWEKDGKKHSETAIGVTKIQLIFDRRNKTESEPDTSIPEYMEMEQTQEMLQEIYDDEPSDELYLNGGYNDSYEEDVF